MLERTRRREEAVKGKILVKLLKDFRLRAGVAAPGNMKTWAKEELDNLLKKYDTVTMKEVRRVLRRMLDDWNSSLQPEPRVYNPKPPKAPNAPQVPQIGSEPRPPPRPASGVPCAPAITHLWPPPVVNPRRESLRKRQQSEWAARMLNDIDKFKSESSRKQRETAEATRRHRMALEKQMDEVRLKVQREKSLDETFVDMQTKQLLAQRREEDEERARLVADKTKAALQMKTELQALDRRKREVRDEVDRRNEAMRIAQQDALDAERQQTLQKSLKKRQLYSQAEEFNMRCLDERRRALEDERRAEIAAAGKTRGCEWDMVSRIKRAEKKKRARKLEKLNNFADTVFTQDMLQSLDDQERVAERKAELERQDINERYRRDIETRRQRKEQQRQEQVEDLHNYQLRQRMVATKERETDVRKKHEMDDIVRETREAEEQLRKHTAQRALEYAAGLREQVLTSKEDVAPNIARPATCWMRSSARRREWEIDFQAKI